MSEENQKEMEVVEAQEELKEELDLQEAESEILEGTRKVDLPNLGEVIISFPSIEIDRESKTIYSKEVTKLMKEGELLPLRAVEKAMRANGSWSDEDDEEVEKLSKEWQSVLLKIEQSKVQLEKATKDSKLRLENKIAELERERFKVQKRLTYLTMTKENLLATSIEEMASRKMLSYKMYKCTSKDDKPIFPSFEDMLNYNESMDLEKLSGYCINFWSGIQDPLLESLLEEMTGS